MAKIRAGALSARGRVSLRVLGPYPALFRDRGEKTVKRQ